MLLFSVSVVCVAFFILLCVSWKSLNSHYCLWLFQMTTMMDMLLAVVIEELYIMNMKMSKSNEDGVCALGHHFKPSSWDWSGAHRKGTKRVNCRQPQPPDHVNENSVTAIPHMQPNHFISISMLSKQESPSKPNKKRIKHSISMLFTLNLPIQFKGKINGMHGQDLKLVI